MNKSFSILVIAAFLIIGLSEVQAQTTEKQDIPFAKRRLVYQIPEMKRVIKKNGIIYYSGEGMNLKMDLYTPPNISKNKRLPLVILISGYPDSSVIKNKWYGVRQKDLELFVSWSELIAASGMIAVTYESEKSSFETDTLIKFLQKNAEKYNIDLNRIAIFGCSANTLTALSLLQESSNLFKCAIFYYGALLTPDQKYFSTIDAAAKETGYYWTDLKKISKIPQEIPLFIVRAGKDKYQIIKASTDYFVSEITKLNIPFIFINYAEGQHDFDILDDTQTSREIIKQTINFLQSHLLSSK